LDTKINIIKQNLQVSLILLFYKFFKNSKLL